MVGEESLIPQRVVMGFSVEVWMVGCLKGFWGSSKGIVWKACLWLWSAGIRERGSVQP